MTTSKAIIIGACIIGALMTGCEDPRLQQEHYYAMCRDPDGQGWPLTDVEKDEKGRLIGCYYRRPDSLPPPVPPEIHGYWVNCYETGCDPQVEP